MNEGNVLFNDAHHTFYLRLYGVRHMVKDLFNSERKSTTYHILCYTSRGALAGWRNSSMKNQSDHPSHLERTLLLRSSFKWSSKVKTLAPGSAVKVVEDRTIDPELLFQRFLVVSQTGDLQIDEMMNTTHTRCLSSKQRTSCISWISHNWRKRYGTMLHPNRKMLSHRQSQGQIAMF